MDKRRKNAVYSYQPQKGQFDVEKTIGDDEDWNDQRSDLVKIFTVKNFFRLVYICLCIVVVVTVFTQLVGFVSVYQESCSKVTREMQDAEKSLGSSTCLYFDNKLGTEEKRKYEESAIRDKKGRENCERYHDYLNSSKMSKILIEVGNSYGMCKYGECSTLLKDVFFKCGVSFIGIFATCAPYMFNWYMFSNRGYQP